MRAAARTFVTLLVVGMALLGRSMHLCACDGRPLHCPPGTAPSNHDETCCSGGSCGEPQASDPEGHHHSASDAHNDHDHGPVAVAADTSCGGHGRAQAEPVSPEPSVTAPCACPTLESSASAARIDSSKPRLEVVQPVHILDQDLARAPAWEPSGHRPSRISRHSSARPPGPLRRHLELHVIRC